MEPQNVGQVPTCSEKLYWMKTILYTVTLILHTWPKDLEIGTSPAESGFLVKMEMLEWLVPWNLRRSFGTICLGLQNGAKITKLHKLYDSLKISKGILKDSKT